MLVYGGCMQGIHSFDEDAFYYCPNKECVCNQRDSDALVLNAGITISVNS
jgi:hypothetical protein